MLRVCVLAVAALGLFACAAPQPASNSTETAAETEQADQASIIEDGREIAEANCARCHAVGTYGDSPNPTAPTFRTVLSRYRADVLEEELIQGIQVAHPMPDFQFNPQGANALMAYLQSIQEAPVE